MDIWCEMFMYVMQIYNDHIQGSSGGRRQSPPLTLGARHSATISVLAPGTQSVIICHFVKNGTENLRAKTLTISLVSLDCINPKLIKLVRYCW